MGLIKSVSQMGIRAWFYVQCVN